MSKSITVADLIKDLEQIEDKSLPVDVEGCDCVGECIGISTDKSYPESSPDKRMAVIINRYCGVLQR